MTAWAAVTAIVGVASILILIRAGKGGSRRGLEASTHLTGDRTPDQCWKWGLIYFNPADPSILIE